MSAAERVEALLEEVLPKIEELEAESMGRISAAKSSAWEKIPRYQEAAGELEGVEKRIEELLSERAGLTELHSEAVLDDDVDEELRLKQRAQDIKAEVESCEERRDGLWRELAELVPRRGPHREPHALDAHIHHVARVAETAAEERRPLEHLRDRFTKALDSAADAVVREHEQSRAQVMAWNRTVEFERSPVGRGAIIS